MGACLMTITLLAASALCSDPSNPHELRAPGADLEWEQGVTTNPQTWPDYYAFTCLDGEDVFWPTEEVTPVAMSTPPATWRLKHPLPACVTESGSVLRACKGTPPTPTPTVPPACGPAL